jgi:hypothetical protein
MQINMRRESRRIDRKDYTLCWQSEGGETRSIEVAGADLSRSGIRVTSPISFPAGAVVFVQARSGTLAGWGVVRHSATRGNGYAVGIALNEETKVTVSFSDDADLDYYSFLQVNPKADWGTIHRVYRIMASRFHPDNPETGDPEKFLILQAAFKTLSDPKLRAAYDASLQSREPGTLPIFELSEFVNGIEGESNRRLGVLSLLYNRRRTSPQSPGISLFDLEKRMGMPREYLEFTTWYLKSKQYITQGDNSEFALTALGVDFVESNSTTTPILQRLLSAGPISATSAKAAAGAPDANAEPPLLRTGPGDRS